MFIEILKQYPNYFDIANIEGYPNEKIVFLEEKFNFDLPSDYKKFLAELGGNAGGLLIGDEFLGYHLEALQDDIKTLFYENNFSYDKPFFCIFMHEGYVADLYAFENGVLGIYQFMDNYKCIKKTHDNFLDYFKEKIEFHILMIDNCRLNFSHN